MTKYDVIVIGAGAAGLVAAGRAAELGANVLVLEKMNKPGLKLLISGNGRCNISNSAVTSEFVKHIYPNGKYLKNVFSEFSNKNLIEFFDKNNFKLIEEENGRLFPKSNSSKDVLNLFLNWIENNKVKIQYDCKVEQIIVKDNCVEGLIYKASSGESNEILCNKIILCTGGFTYQSTGSTGDGYKIAKQVGHSIEQIRPSLVPLETEMDLIKDLQGLSLSNTKASVWVNGKKQIEDIGEMLFTHYGLSGPLILNISRFVVDELMKKNTVEISLDFHPELDEQKLDAAIINDLNVNGKKHIENVFKHWLPARLMNLFFEKFKINPDKECHQLIAKDRRYLVLLMKDFRLKVNGHRGFKEAMVTAGGIKTDEVNSKTMESKIIKNLFFAGEVLDLDADTGGFNLQIAFSTAWVAANSAVKI